MGITVEFDGFYRNVFKNVSPCHIVLQGRTLLIKGTRVPVAQQQLYNLFYFLSEKTSYKHGKVTVVLLKNGDIKYLNRTSNNTPDYFAGKILGFGMMEHYNILPRRIEEIPDDDTYMTGEDC